MNVPLKKRHNYGKMNGSATSHSGPNAKPSSNGDDSDQISCIEVDSSSNDDLQANMRELSNTLLQTQGDKTDKTARIQRRYSTKPQKSVKSGFDETTDLTSSSEIMVSTSASDHDSASEQNGGANESGETSGSDESENSGSSKGDSDNTEAQYYRRLLTEEAVKMHELYFPPMSTYDRISYWKLADECSEIEDDFDETLYASQPLRSERLQKRSYKRPASVYSVTSRKTRKNAKIDKKDDAPPAKKPKIEEKPKTKPTKVADKKTPAKSKPKPKRNIWKNLPPSTKQTVPQPIQREANKVPIIEPKTPDEIPSAIKLRISYNKTPSPATTFRVSANTNNARPRMLETSFNSRNSAGCLNCSSKTVDKINGSMASASALFGMTKNNREEFYKYLGIDTKPPQDKLSPEPSTSDAQQQQRRSLRVFIQQKQMESVTRSNEELRKVSDIETSPHSPFKRNSCGALNINSSTASHIQQRRSYDPLNTSPPYNGNVLNKSNRAILPNENEKTEHEHKMRFEQKRAKSMVNGPTMNGNLDARSESRVVRIRRRRNSLLPSPMMLDEIFKRYKKCIQQGYVIRNQLQNQQFVKRSRKHPADKSSTSKADDRTSDAQPATVNDCDVIEQPIKNQESTSAKCDGPINSLTPAPIIQSNGSTDSAIVIHQNGIDNIQPTISIDQTNSLEWHEEQTNEMDKTQIRNPLNMENGCVRAILTHSKSPDHDDIVVVVQENLISFWQVPSRVLCMFGLPRAWMHIGQIQRVDHRDIEIPSLYQHRLIDYGSDFPAYVELRVRESAGDECRQSCLSFTYLNVYFVKANENGQPIVCMESINLDTIKGYASSIGYIALRNSPSILMTWTEFNVNNQSRCGIVKYTMRIPTFDKIVDIFDYSYLQHDINTLYELNDHHVVGCGDRTISMWDHQTGSLLIDFEIDLPTIGRNIGCYTIGVEKPEYMLLIQLTSSEENPQKESLMKVMAVQTVDPYNWRTLQTYNIPNTFGRIQSIFDNDNMLTISFTSGTFILLNILSPHTVYVRNMNWQNKQPHQPLLRNALNGVSASDSNKKDIHDTKQMNSNRLFAQPNGQTIEIRDNYVMTKSIWEYFVDK